MYNITANIISNNERYWIKESILSIVKIVSEIIYVDDRSDDGTLQIVEELSKTYNNIKVFKYEDHKTKHLGELKNFALSKSTNEFVIRWDADFIAYDDITDLFEFCISHREIYDGYILCGPNLSGDINHYHIGKEKFGPECYLFKKDKSKFVQNSNFPDYPKFEQGFRFCYPLKTKLNKDFFFLHTSSLKSIERLSYRKRMCDYQISEHKGTYWEWLSNGRDPEQIKRSEINRTLTTPLKLNRFDHKKWGEHPNILLNSDSINEFIIIESDGDFKILKYPV